MTTNAHCPWSLQWLLTTTAMIGVCLFLTSNTVRGDDSKPSFALNDLKNISKKVETQLRHVFGDDTPAVSEFVAAQQIGDEPVERVLRSLAQSHQIALCQLSDAIWGMTPERTQRYALPTLPATVKQSDVMDRYVNVLIDRSADIQKVLYRDSKHVPPEIGDSE